MASVPNRRRTGVAQRPRSHANASGTTADSGGRLSQLHLVAARTGDANDVTARLGCLLSVRDQGRRRPAPDGDTRDACRRTAVHSLDAQRPSGSVPPPRNQLRGRALHAPVPVGRRVWRFAPKRELHLTGTGVPDCESFRNRCQRRGCPVRPVLWNWPDIDPTRGASPRTALLRPGNQQGIRTCLSLALGARILNEGWILGRWGRRQPARRRVPGTASRLRRSRSTVRGSHR